MNCQQGRRCPHHEVRGEARLKAWRAWLARALAWVKGLR
jgi:hypothetical protein